MPALHPFFHSSKCTTMPFISLEERLPKRLFYFGALGLILFEIANVYFIMPMPGSQEMESISLAYFLHKWRWTFRLIFGAMTILGLKAAFRDSKIFSLLFLTGVSVVGYFANFEMAADAMFLQPKNLQFKPAADSHVDSSRIVIGIVHNGQAKAYPIQYLGYHHQVFDTLADQPVMVTYCTVCRTGRVFEPTVNGQTETFRLVGMDHFNAMFEDKTTKSWWRQVTGEAIAGKLKGQFLPEFPSTQMGLDQWLRMYPNSLIMQPDPEFSAIYDSLSNYENGNRKGSLTRRDTLPWQDKSWVIGVALGNESKAFDWIDLEKERIIHDVIGNQPVAVVLAGDNKSFVALRRTDKNQRFTIDRDTLSDGQTRYNFIGTSLDPLKPDLQKINAYQEYWHSWRTFHPSTTKY